MLPYHLSVCIVTWNSVDEIGQCLRSVIGESRAAGLKTEIIVVDNASSDGTCEVVRRDFPEVILLRNSGNDGFGKANNRAISITRAKYVLLLNPDIVLIEPCLRRMLSCLENDTDERIGIVACRLVDEQGAMQKSFYTRYPTPFTELEKGLWGERKAIVPSDSHEVEVSWVIGACMLLRRGLLRDLGGFDERFFMYKEDLDLCYRVRSRSLKIWFLHDIKMLHFHGASTRKHPDRQFASLMQKEATFKYMALRHGSIAAYQIRLAWIVAGLWRIAVVVIGYPIFTAVLKKKRVWVVETVKKYASIIRWGVMGLPEREPAPASETKVQYREGSAR